MMTDIASPRVESNTRKHNPAWITWGSGRRLPHTWETVHAFALEHGWAFIRLGNVLVGYPADVTEGRA